MDFVAENCTSVAVFDHGKIYKTGTPKQIFSNSEEVKALGLELPLIADLLITAGCIDKAEDLKEQTAVRVLTEELGGAL
jgi:ABC-type methionine transport system ATPase subunit